MKVRRGAELVIPETDKLAYPHEGHLHCTALTMWFRFDPETSHLMLKAELSVWSGSSADIATKQAPQSDALPIPGDTQVPPTGQETSQAQFPARNKLYP